MPVIYIVGDSTVDDNSEPFRGWGWAIPKYVREGVIVRNYAQSGCSSRSFTENGLFQSVEQRIGPGDLLLIQFGHNDEKPDDRYTGPEDTFPEYLGRYVGEALDHGARAALITPLSRRFFEEDGSLRETHGAYPDAIRALAKREGIPLADLTAKSRELFLKLGPEKTAELFVRIPAGTNPEFPEGHDDKTHLNAFGAEIIAGIVAEELRKIPSVAGYLKV